MNVSQQTAKECISLIVLDDEPDLTNKTMNCSL